MYLYIFLFCFSPSMRNNSLGGLTYTLPDYYYRLNAYDFGKLTAGLIMDDSGNTYIDGYYLMDKDSLWGTSYTGCGHLRFNNKEKIALDIDFNNAEYSLPWATDTQGNLYTFKNHFINTSAEIAYAINNKAILGIGGGEQNNYINPYHYSFIHLKGSFLYSTKFSLGSRIEYKYMNYPEDASYNSIIIAGLYGFLPVSDNLRVGTRIDAIKQDTLQSFSARIRFEFTPAKQIIIGGEIMGANFTESNYIRIYFPAYSYFDPGRTGFLTLGIAYKKGPIFVGIEDYIRKVKYSYSDRELTYSMSKIGVEIHKQGAYIRGGINSSIDRVFNFSFGMGCRYKNISIDYFYNHKEQNRIFYEYNYNRGSTNGLSFRIIF